MKTLPIVAIEDSVDGGTENSNNDIKRDRADSFESAFGSQPPRGVPDSFSQPDDVTARPTPPACAPGTQESAATSPGSSQERKRQRPFVDPNVLEPLDDAILVSGYFLTKKLYLDFMKKWHGHDEEEALRSWKYEVKDRRVALRLNDDREIEMWVPHDAEDEY